ncbi:putative porin [Sediminicola sp. 1XM1-17]|uniref:putative porin n=1 Tax=Sediminicola sp. 1XM1-17 TaxID=3127702 RepID=UPI003077A0EB
MRYLVVLLFICNSSLFFGQDRPTLKVSEKDTTALAAQKKFQPLNKGKEKPEFTIEDYKIISYARDTTYLDTTISIQKEYKYNFLRKDNFELMPFSNIGQPYNSLGVTVKQNTLYPSLGAEAKHFNYMEVQDINYYRVPTPMTELMFKTTFEQGQLLDALLTFNMNPRLNISLAYKGFRSLGKYQFNEAESGNFRTTATYETKDLRYRLRAHIAAQDILSEENGGLSNKVTQFESGDPEFTDRSRIDVFFTNANNKVLGKRYFYDHQYDLFKRSGDAAKARTNYLSLGHQFIYETKYYEFGQTAQDAYFGDAFVSTIKDKANLKTMYNQGYLELGNKTLGTLKGNVALYNYNYYFDSKLITASGEEISNQLKGEEVTVGAHYQKNIGGFELNGGVDYGVSGELTGNIINASASYMLQSGAKATFAINSSSKMPNFNYLLYQSDYVNYNWQNNEVFEKERVNGLMLGLDSKLLGNLSAEYNTMENYTYFTSTATQEQIDAGEENAAVRPFQEGNSINYVKIKYNKEFKLGYFALNNTLMYQQVDQTNNVLNVPQWVTRNTLYFSKDVFDRAMHLQTGITFKYFTAYNMDAYNPLLGEFYIQNRQELGGYPMLDFFINAKVKQTRLFLKAEHFNSSFSGFNFYSAPNYPYRDFVIRFGLVWNFFS